MRFIDKTSRVASVVRFWQRWRCWSSASRATAQEPLRWKFEQGEKLDYNMVQDMNDGGRGRSARRR